MLLPSLPHSTFHPPAAAPHPTVAPTLPPQSARFIQKLGGWSFVFWFNWVIIAFTAVFGFGMGGYSSIKVG